MRKFIFILLALLIVSGATAQTTGDIVEQISKQTGHPYACVEQAVASGNLVITPGGHETCDDGDCIRVTGFIDDCLGGGVAERIDKVIVLEWQDARAPK